MKRSIKVLLSCALFTFSSYSLAFSDAAKIGANAGAMSYCKDNVISKNQRFKYNALAARSLREFNELGSGERTKALIWKNAANNGEYLGKPLTKKRCESVRNSLFVLYGM